MQHKIGELWLQKDVCISTASHTNIHTKVSMLAYIQFIESKGFMIYTLWNETEEANLLPFRFLEILTTKHNVGGFFVSLF
jgi:hypothetical protein